MLMALLQPAAQQGRRAAIRPLPAVPVVALFARRAALLHDSWSRCFGSSPGAPRPASPERGTAHDLLASDATAPTPVIAPRPATATAARRRAARLSSGASGSATLRELLPVLYPRARGPDLLLLRFAPPLAVSTSRAQVRRRNASALACRTKGPSHAKARREPAQGSSTAPQRPENSRTKLLVSLQAAPLAPNRRRGAEPADRASRSSVRACSATDEHSSTASKQQR